MASDEKRFVASMTSFQEFLAKRENDIDRSIFSRISGHIATINTVGSYITEHLAAFEGKTVDANRSAAAAKAEADTARAKAADAKAEAADYKAEATVANNNAASAKEATATAKSEAAAARAEATAARAEATAARAEATAARVEAADARAEATDANLQVVRLEEHLKHCQKELAGLFSSLLRHYTYWLIYCGRSNSSLESISQKTY